MGGSGITGASAGLGFLDSSLKQLDSTAIVCLCLAACSADALCMSIGMVWSTYILADASAEERKHEQNLLRTTPSESKALRVDIFLVKGMLKIDAMSLADTLEGYPDIFLTLLTSPNLANADITSNKNCFLDTVYEDNSASNKLLQFHGFQEDDHHDSTCWSDNVDPKFIQDSRNEAVIFMVS